MKKQLKNFVASFTLANFIIAQIFSLGFFIPKDRVLAATQLSETKSASIFENDNSVGNSTWTDLNNVATNDVDFSEVSFPNNTIINGETTNYFKAKDFSFNIPENSTIDGIIVSINRKASAAGWVAEDVLSLMKDGNISGDNKAIPSGVSGHFWPVNPGNRNYPTVPNSSNPTVDVTNDLWGQSWNATDINDTDFGVALSTKIDNSSNSNTTKKARIYYISITVYYTPPTNIAPTITTSAPTTATEDTLYMYDADSTDSDGPIATWSKTASDTCGGEIDSTTGVYTFTPVGPTPAISCDIAIRVDDSGSPNQFAEKIETISIVAVNDAPTVSDNSVSTSEDNFVSINLSGVDPENDTLSFSIISGPTSGTLGDIMGSSVTYTPNENFTGNDSFTFKANDSNADSNTGTISISVGAINDAPVAQTQSVTTDEDIQKIITLVGIDSDNDTLSFSINTNPSHGSINLIGDQVTYTPNTNYNGSDSFIFEVSDGQVSSTAVVNVQINSVNDAPVLSLIGNKTIDENINLSFTISGNDLETDSLSFSVLNLPSRASFDSNTKTFSWTPGFEQSGNYNPIFSVCDIENSCDSEEITITVNNVVQNNNQEENNENDNQGSGGGGSVVFLVSPLTVVSVAPITTLTPVTEVPIPIISNPVTVNSPSINSQVTSVSSAPIFSANNSAVVLPDQATTRNILVEDNTNQITEENNTEKIDAENLLASANTGFGKFMKSVPEFIWWIILLMILLIIISAKYSKK